MKPRLLSAKEIESILIGKFTKVADADPVSFFEFSKGKTEMKFEASTQSKDEFALCSAHTWRELPDKQSFWPGRLDLIIYSKYLLPMKALILNTHDLKPWQHRELKWTQKEYSLASDHLMFISDFAISK